MIVYLITGSKFINKNPYTKYRLYTFDIKNKEMS